MSEYTVDLSAVAGIPIECNTLRLLVEKMAELDDGGSYSANGFSAVRCGDTVRVVRVYVTPPGALDVVLSNPPPSDGRDAGELAARKEDKP